MLLCFVVAEGISWPCCATASLVLSGSALQMVSDSHVGTAWAQAADWSLLHSLDRPLGQLCQLRLLEQQGDYGGPGL